MNRRHWIPEEDAFVRANHRRMTAAEIGYYLQRPRTAVAKRIEVLGLAASHWSPADEELVRRHYGSLPASQIGSLLGRSARAVGHKARSMDLPRRRRRRWTAEEERRVLEEYGRTPTADLARALNRTELAVYMKALYLGVPAAAPLSADGRELLWDLREQPGVETFFARQFGVRETVIRTMLERMQEVGGPG